MLTDDHAEPAVADDGSDDREWPPGGAAGLKPPWFRLGAADDELTVSEDPAGGQLLTWRRCMYEDGAFRRFEHVTIERTDRIDIVGEEFDLGHGHIVVDASADEPCVATWLVHAIEDATAILWPAA